MRTARYGTNHEKEKGSEAAEQVNRGGQVRYCGPGAELVAERRLDHVDVDDRSGQVDQDPGNQEYRTVAPLHGRRHTDQVRGGLESPGASLCGLLPGTHCTSLTSEGVDAALIVTGVQQGFEAEYAGRSGAL